VKSQFYCDTRRQGIVINQVLFTPSVVSDISSNSVVSPIRPSSNWATQRHGQSTNTQASTEQKKKSIADVERRDSHTL